MNWQDVLAPTALKDTATEMLANITPSGMEPVNLASEPQLSDLVNAIDITEVLGTVLRGGTPVP